MALTQPQADQSDCDWVPLIQSRQPLTYLGLFSLGRTLPLQGCVVMGGFWRFAVFSAYRYAF